MPTRLGVSADAAAVLIEDEFLRDGLQGETVRFSAAEKVRVADDLAACGLRRIQVGAFVHPGRVPQMANTDEVFDLLAQRPDVVFSALVLNMRGIERAITAGVRHLSMSISASETHSRRNTNQTLREARANILPMIERAQAAGIAVRAGVQCAFGDKASHPAPPAGVIDIAKSYADAGVSEINLADTAGLASPSSVTTLISQVRDAIGTDVRLSLHLHDTRGLGIANLIAGLQAGVTIFDAALGGVGGCPFIDGATGNIATEDTTYALERMGINTGVDWRRLCAISAEVGKKLGRALPGRMVHLEQGVM
jgi:hydroxymethylglutaryl-CoA lyase